MVPGVVGPGRALPHVQPAQGAALRALPAGRAAPQAPGPHGGPHPPAARLRPLPPHPQRRPGPGAPGESGEPLGKGVSRVGGGLGSCQSCSRTNPLSFLAVVDIAASILFPAGNQRCWERAPRTEPWP